MEGFLLIFTIAFTVLYTVLILLYLFWFGRLKQFIHGKNLPPKTTFSVIIPARNEAQNIEDCVRSILNNNYPGDLFEVIVVDDFSTDATAAIVEQLRTKYNNLKLIQLKNHLQTKENSYKKKAIETAIAKASNEWIITTDADCVVTKNWFTNFDNIIQQKQPVFVAAPVQFINNGSFISVFQCLDFISLQGITAASVAAGFLSMCNGANLAYKKTAFNAVNGFKGVDNIASGDDMLLMHKIKKQFPAQVAYLFSKESIVRTQPMPDLKSFINQRIRWASKASSYDDKKIFAVLLLVYLYNLSLFIMLIAGIFYPPLFIDWLVLLAVKTFIELLFMYPVTKFFGEEKLLWWFPLMQPFHVAYTVISGWLGKFGKYEWKGRQVK